MVIGIDFDNTIICYDEVFHRAALEKALIPSTVPVRKNDVRDYLRSQGQEQAWTELQGLVYGTRMNEATPFPGFTEFLERGTQLGLPMFIISHKTPTPAVGPAYDLHKAAMEWLRSQRFIEPAAQGLPLSHIHFGSTREEKIQWIRKTACTHFIDDLEEVFREESFPAEIVKILFAQTSPLPERSWLVAPGWPWITDFLFNAAG
jgi:hypothetical protein